jgi:hypothetical protein
MLTLLTMYSAVTVDRNLHIVRFHGRTGRYLEWPPGEPTRKLLRMVRHGLRDIPLEVKLERRLGDALP